MKKLSDFAINTISEHRGQPKLKEVEGKKAQKWGSKGAKWAIDEPEDNTAQRVKIPKEEMSKNIKRLKMKFDTEEPFFIQGRAGWGKTSIIKDMANKYNYTVITVYLDKAVASDLGGIPIPTKGKSGAVQEMAMPAWAKIMDENQDKKFLLFFDEMNQAAPDVMNALMPIVLENEICNVKFENFFVGAAGNFEDENRSGVSDLSGPLKSRFKPIIIWETGGDEWTNAFKYLHKTWDNKLSKNLINKFEENVECFENPREIEHKIFKFISKLKESGAYEDYDAEDYLDRLQGIAKDELSRHQEAALQELAEYINDFLNNKEDKKSGRSSRGDKDINMVPKNIVDNIQHGMKFGFISQEEDGKTVKYGISRENIDKIQEWNWDDCNAEMLQRIINKFEANGLKFKFEKDEQWKKAGYKDPNED